jgi:predicted RNase H-like HicB family nuclease
MEITAVSGNDSAQAYLRLPYARILIPEEDGGFSAEMLEFPGCFAEGETADEAIHNLDEVAESWIEAAQEQGLEIPQPTANQPYAGRIALRLPRDLHRLAVRKAQRDGTSLNQYLVTAIAAWIGADNLLDKLVHRTQQIQTNFVQFAAATPPQVQANDQYRQYHVGGTMSAFTFNTFSGGACTAATIHDSPGGIVYSTENIGATQIFPIMPAGGSITCFDSHEEKPHRRSARA